MPCISTQYGAALAVPLRAVTTVFGRPPRVDPVDGPTQYFRCCYSVYRAPRARAAFLARGNFSSRSRPPQVASTGDGRGDLRGGPRVAPPVFVAARPCPVVLPRPCPALPFCPGPVAALPPPLPPPHNLPTRQLPPCPVLGFGGGEYGVAGVWLPLLLLLLRLPLLQLPLRGVGVWEPTEWC
ncbi:unnamed protein product [Closterium sp. NIES-54]